MMDIETLKGKLPQIFFDEWNDKDKIGKWFELHIYDLTATPLILRDKREYYLFYGYFIKDNAFRLGVNVDCYFWISKHSFEQEIVRHILFNSAPHKFDLELSLRRVGKFKIEIRSTTIMELGKPYKHIL